MNPMCTNWHQQPATQKQVFSFPTPKSITLKQIYIYENNQLKITKYFRKITIMKERHQTQDG
jgi:hypothetical protein